MLTILILTACGAQPQAVTKIALLAPFEGRYREVGYNALYAARLAIADSGNRYIDLLAIDDGGSIESASDRAQAIQYDPAIAMTLALGPYATTESVQTAFEQHPVLIVGHWNAQPAQSTVAILASSVIDSRLTVAEALIPAFANGDSPLIGSEILALKQIPQLRTDLDDITVLSSASLPDAEFTQRYLESDPFAPQPGLLASLAYDATALAVQSITTDTPLQAIHYEGINGTIIFEDGYWIDAPVNEYEYENGLLVAARGGA